ncbi:MAG: energy transducer TonB [Sphingobacteriales bacterium]|nr:MAG: energy transducer TonB [Sphingobacteriales bacterium]
MVPLWNDKIIKMKIISTILVCILLSSFVSAQSIDTKNASLYAEQMPEFSGGQDSLISFLARNIQYPEKAKTDLLEGKVIAKFIVNTNGNVSDATILYDIGGGCGDEVLRVIKLMPKWNAGKRDGRTVAVYYNLPVSFYLDDKEPVKK